MKQFKRRKLFYCLLYLASLFVWVDGLSQSVKSIPFTKDDKLYYLYINQRGRDTTILSISDTIVVNQNNKLYALNINKETFKILFKTLCTKTNPPIAFDSILSIQLSYKVFDFLNGFESKEILKEHWGIQLGIYNKIEANIQEINIIDDSISRIRKKQNIIKYTNDQFIKSINDTLANPYGRKFNKDSVKKVSKRIDNLKKYKLTSVDYLEQRQLLISAFDDDTIAQKRLKWRIRKIETDNQELDSLNIKCEALRLNRVGIARETRILKNKYSVPELALTGNALTLFKDGNNNQQTTTGIGINVDKADIYEFAMQMTVSQSQDTIAGGRNDIRQFGSSLLIPGIRKYSLLTNYRYFSLFPFSNKLWLRKIGFGFSLNVTPMIWKKDTLLAKKNSARVVNVIPGSADFYLSVNWLNSNSPDREFGKIFRISTDIGISNRVIFGDLSQDEKNREFYLSNKQIIYSGIYLGINIRIDDLSLYFNGPILFGPPVSGLTQGQAIANIGIRGNILKIK